MSEERREWAVRWPDGEIEECDTLAQARQVIRLHIEPVLVVRVVTVGPWETA